MTAEQFANNASSTLNGGIGTGNTTLVVTSATPFPTIAQFRLLLGATGTGEIVLVTNVSGTTFTITRAQENTTAQTWADTSPVTHILTAAAVSAIRTMGGDASGTTDNITVTKLQNKAVLQQTLGATQDGYVLTWDNTNNDWAGKVPLTGLVWGTTQTSAYTIATTDIGVPVDTTSGAVYITLPPAPFDGERHTIADVGGVADTNSIIVSANGKTINGLSTLTITGRYNVLEITYHLGKGVWIIT